MFRHVPVLYAEIYENFKELPSGSFIVDGTLGKGGHSKVLLEKGFNVIGVDRDKEAIDEAKKWLGGFSNMQFAKGNFSELREILWRLKKDKVSGILLDLGVSTYQLESEERGFGFVGRLDMRMDRDQELTAEKVINEYPEERLTEVFRKYGERACAREISRSVCKYRRKRRIERGGQFLKLVKYSMSERYRNSRKHHWASPAFRALRMEVNKDFEHLNRFLRVFGNCLVQGGILQLITFHTMEDRVVKEKFKTMEKKGYIKMVTKEPIRATEEEIKENPKAARARLWVVRLL